MTANGDSISGVTETSSGSAASAAVGSDAIVPSAATGTGLNNYNISYVAGALTITPATLGVTANPQSKVYGQGDPGLTYAATGFENGDTSSILSGCLERAGGENVGSYAIGEGTLSAGSNYTIGFIGNDLTITPATLGVTADPQSKVYGQGDPGLTYAATGFENGDTSSILSGGLGRRGRERRQLRHRRRDAFRGQQLHDRLHRQRPDDHARHAGRHGRSPEQGLRPGRPGADLRRDGF